ncbi:monovalent cation:proton antiporter family protein [Saccharococcus caldoxylosilyticus]|uniref:Putative Na(+)/H(+) antiporter n=1 Tax=Parageobacillus caldoxylosilyticus NBRC 107762 TaxID=1220594 RepID=A0A023DFQ9_9BACL|nr:monovalent cation:proton antiporter family protein [Parageobacillus caldoxylosilyticus]OQP00147.1 sodium:proton antiporter [Geobacillus sp. 44B]MBB3851659.1 CPA2 family monovalent cation:H+ antiporter-2 [Parageobacillus caldoxylosilyticus]QNU37468.1 monovalent cation:proton antiporter family protein [Geobacillus sp. 44B]BDG35501.1 putative Na(+)/H(+) antiporter YjbQ [Parageobacillus caldoxylosilyticus]BDG39280.1 putative Na(+)/H(+) antiporter YjbQ [Parageobacillus caldoxylosilyticus]
MAEQSSITSLLIVVVVAFLTPILLNRLRLQVIPVVVAEIIAGIMIGKTGFNLVKPDMWIETLSTLGFLFLMFLSGLEIDFSAFANKPKANKKQKEPNQFVVASIIFLAIFVLSYGLSYLFVLAGYIDNAFLMTLIISTISLGVVVPTLKDTNLMKTTIGQTILLVAVIADLATMILLAVFVSIYESGHKSVWLLLGLFAAGVVFYFVGKYFKKRSFVETMAKGTVQIGTRAVFTLIIVLVALSETFGAENILGAFLAGVLVSLLSPNKELMHQLDSFGYGFFIPIFFVMVGVDLDLRALVTEPKILMMIPLLVAALAISKIIPVSLLKIWYDTKTTLAAAFLLVSTLSLVIAAATIAERIGVIDENMKGALILVAVISSIISPILFKKLFVKPKEEDKKIAISFIGTNQFTLSAAKELDEQRYEATLYHIQQEKMELPLSDHVFPIVDIEDYSLPTLEKHKAFAADIVVAWTGNEKVNAAVALAAKERGVERVLALAETPTQVERLKEEGIETMSVLLSSTSMLKASIESPRVARMFINKDATLHEITMNNNEYDGIPLRRFPFMGDCIIVRIFRENESIVPHGDTKLQKEDRLIVTGSGEYVNELRELLE